MREQIAEFLAQGFKQGEVANMVGTTASAISELIKDESFKELLKEKMTVYTQKRLSTKYDALEENTLNKIKDQIEMCDVGELTRVLESISRIKAANRPTANVGTYSNPTVGLTLIFPSSNIPQLVTDERNQVIAIGSKSMAPMPAANVKAMFADMEKTPLIEDHQHESERLRVERDAAIAAAQERFSKSA